MKIKPKDCRFCGSDGVAAVEVDQQWNENVYAVRCESCFAEGPHCVSEEMAIRMWGFEYNNVPQPEPPKYDTFGLNWHKFPGAV